MSAGEKEILKAIEETVSTNLSTMQNFGNETRKVVRECENKIIGLQEENRNLKSEISQLRIMLANVQARVYSGGT